MTASSATIEEKNRRVKKTVIADYAVFCVGLILMGMITFRLFLRQAGADETTFVYFSDMVVYVREMLGTETQCVFPYQVYFKLGAFVNLFSPTPEAAMAFTTMALNLLAVVCAKVFLNRACNPLRNPAVGTTEHTADRASHIFTEKNEASFLWQELLPRLLITAAVFGLFLVSMLFTPSSVKLPGILHQYMGVFSPTPWHNATYLAARPFAILTFIWNIRLLNKYETEKIPLEEYLIFAGVLFLCVMTKPSFMVVHLGATGLVMLYRLFRSKFRIFKQTILLGLCYLPVFGGLLYQFSSVYVDEVETAGEGGIGFGLAPVWNYYCHNIPLALVLAAAFPLLVLILHLGEIKKNSIFRHGFQIYGMGFLMNFFMYEKGHKFYDFNYCWGYMYGLFFAFLGSLQVLLRDTKELVDDLFFLHAKNADDTRNEKESQNEKKVPLLRVLLILLQWAVFGLHLLCGLYFFYKLLGGAKYD